MNNYDVEMLRGTPRYEDIRVRLFTDNRVLLDNIMSAIDQVYQLWYDNKISSHNDRIKVEVM